MTLVVPNAAGGGYDTYARALAPAIEAHSGLTVRVVNMTSGGGAVAPVYVANSQNDDLLVLIQNSADLITGEFEQSGENGGPRTFLIEKFDVVGIIQTEPGAWLGALDIDILDPERTNIVSGQGTFADAIFPVLMAGRAIGMTADVVTGYEGSSDQAAGVLRGETEVTTNSITSALKGARSGDLKILMVMSNGPWPDTPDVPYLAGEGGVAWQRSEGLSQEERDLRMSLALLAANIGGSTRGIHMSTNVTQERRDCVSDILSVALFDPLFVDSAESQGRAVQPITGDDARAYVEQARQSFLGAIETYDELAVIAE